VTVSIANPLTHTAPNLLRSLPPGGFFDACPNLAVLGILRGVRAFACVFTDSGVNQIERDFRRELEGFRGLVTGLVLRVHWVKG